MSGPVATHAEDLPAYGLLSGLRLFPEFASQRVPPALPAISPPPTTQPPEAEAPGVIQGTVLSGATGGPLRRAQVLLKPADSKGTPLYQTTDESGGFSFPKVAPGRYTITVQREGYLPLSAGRIGDYKMPPIFSVELGPDYQLVRISDDALGRRQRKGEIRRRRARRQRRHSALSLLLRARASRLRRGCERPHRRSRRVSRAWPGTGHVLRRGFVSSAAASIRRRRTDAQGRARQSPARVELRRNVFPSGSKNVRRGSGEDRARR